MSGVRVALDLQGAQSIEHRDRGVARYVLEHARAIHRTDPDIVEAFLLNPDLPPPGGIEDLLATGRVVSGLAVALDPDTLVHVMSPFELSIPFSSFLPRDRADHRVVTTLYDLIPDILADRYLQDPGLRRRWRTRAEVVRRAHAVVAISACTARDGIERLGLSPERVTVVGTGTSAAFVPAADRDRARDEARRRIPGLGRRWVLYTGGTDERKNVERLLEGWARLPDAVRSDWQLVIACAVNDLQRNHLLVRADELGFAGGLLVPGFVPDDLLVLLNQGADLAVYPSLYEGYGLPVAEALACGTPAIAADTSSLVELVPAEGLFDPTDPGAIAASIDAALRDPARRSALTAAAGRPPDTWDDVASRTLTAYQGVISTDRPFAQRRPRPRRRRIAFVSPMPPQTTGVADFSYRLLEEMAGAAPHLQIDVFVDGPPHLHDQIRAAQAPPGVLARPLASLDRVEALTGLYDEVVVSLGNSEFHTGGLALLLRRPSIVLAHDVVLTNLWRFAPWQHPDAVPDGFAAALHDMYGPALPADLGASGEISSADAQRWGITMARAAIAASSRYIVTSEFAASWAVVDAAPADKAKITSMPFPMGARPLGSDNGATRAARPVIASFGLVDEAKQPLELVRALATLDRDTEVVFVGPVAGDQADVIRIEASRLGVQKRVRFTGAVDAVGYRSWLAEAWVAVQLRSVTNGESSAAVGDCLAAGLPTVITAIGSGRDIPAEAAVKIEPGAEAGLGDVLQRLIGDPRTRAALQAGALAYAGRRTFRHAAEALAEHLAAVAPAEESA